MKTGEIYIYNSLKNLQIYNFLYQISTFYKIISPKILHLQTPLLSTILQYFFSVFLHSTLIFLAKSTIYKTPTSPQRSIQTVQIILFFLQCCWPLCHHHPLCHQQCAQHLLLYSRCYRFAHVGMFWNLCQQHNVSVFSFFGTTNTTLFGSAEQFLDIWDIIKHLSRTMTIFQLIQIFRIKWFCCP